MFSEYASKFLSQSNHGQGENSDSNARTQNQRRTNQQRGPSRLNFQRPSPYHPTASIASGFPLPFGSRYSAAPPDAPLFHSALQEFQEEDSYEEHQRMAADFAALQQSRRAFGIFDARRIGEESESDTGSEGNDSAYQDHRGTKTIEEQGRGRGIRSSWRGSGKQTDKGRATSPEVGAEVEEHGHTSRTKDWWKKTSVPIVSEDSSSSSKGRGAMEDVKLASTIADSEPPDDLINEAPAYDETPPDLQRFRYGPGPINLNNSSRRVEDIEASAGLSRQFPGEIAPPLATAMGEPPRHDAFYGTLYLICIGGLLAIFFLVLLHTEASSGKLPDTIYSTLHASFYLLAVYTVAAVFVGLLWLTLLKSFGRPLVYLLLVAVPVILFSFSMLGLTASFKGTARTHYQDIGMRWLSFIPLVLTFVWCYTVYKGRHSITKAIGILEFSTKILVANSALVTMGFATLASVVSFTWIWLVMFTRVFLEGHTSKSGSIFVIDGTTWWLAVYFVLMYLWTISVISGIQRATTAATVSQWYFHRNQFPAVSSQETVQSAFYHATTTLFGTISFSTGLALLIRLPFILLPRRVSRIMTAVAYSFVPASIMELISPLTLTYAAIHSQPLQPSAQGISSMNFLSPTLSTTTPRTFSSRTHNPLTAYHLAKLLLRATRAIMAVSLGFGGWVATARQLPVGGKDSGLKGSAYAYVVGMVAGFIGWTILGAMEGVLGGIVDSALVCYGSENNGAGNGGGFCLEAAHLFGEDMGRGNAY